MISARQLAFEVLSGVSRDAAYANLLLTKLQNDAGLESRDAALAQELAFGAIRWRSFYELILEECSGRSMLEIDQAAQILLLLGCHQLLATRIPVHAAISETVELSKRHLNPGGVGFVNGVLRRVSEKSFNSWQELMQSRTTSRIEMLSIRHSHPVWIIKAFEQALELDGLEAQLEALLELDNIPAQVNVVALPGLCPPEELVALGLEHGTASPIGFTMKSGNPSNLKAIREGRARVQDQGSQLVALALIEAKPLKDDEKWLDICAGPGGKAALLAALAITDRAELTCNEIAAHRSKLVESALKPINPNIYVRTGDGRDLGEDSPETFDRILLDAPCTGLGSLRRKPEARWTKSTEDIPELLQLQKQLLQSAWKGLKPGGVLAYSTCSPHVSETIAVVDWFLKEYPSALLLNAQQVLKNVNPNLEFRTKRNTAQLWTTVHGTDSMFLALIAKPIG